jgi:2'-5' RNA ligase
MPDGGAIRAFLAVPPDPAWSATAAGLLSELRREAPMLPAASWTRPEAWHLTLKFLGDTPPAALEELGRAVSDAAAGVSPGDLVSAGPVVFPPAGPPRVLGIAFASSPGLEVLSALAAAAEESARRLGLPREDRAYHPHVTLARTKTRWPKEAVARYREVVSSATPRLPAWPIRSCVLYASRLGPAGAVHTALAEWDLGPGVTPAGASA